MKVILDENLHARLGSFLTGHEVVHVTKAGFAGKKNGELLRLCVSAGFEAFITMDQNLQYQQNLQNLSIKIIVVRAVNNRLETLRKYVEKIQTALTDKPNFVIIG